MTTIYLIRHAEAEGNLYRIAQGQKNSLLTDRGWRQVQALEQRFADVHIDAIYSSDLYRTCATASAIYKPKGLPLQRRAGLREISVGDWEQHTWGEIYRMDPVQMDNFSNHLTLWHTNGAETPYQVLERVQKTLKEIAAENDGKTVAVFSHGYAIRLLLATLQGIPMEKVGETPHGDNTAVSLLEIDGDDWRVVFRDDNSHLQTPEFLAKEKVRKRANALEPGLWFRPVTAEELQSGIAGMLAEQAWHDAGEGASFDRGKFLADAARYETLIGYLREEPVGLVQVQPETGWISFLYIREDCRKRGFGVQLIGQAVYLTRFRDGETLQIALRPDSNAHAFFADYGFSPAETMENGRVVLRKGIGFDPEYLS